MFLTRFRRAAALAVVAPVTLTVMSACASGGGSGANTYGTIDAGQLKVAIESYMPYTGLKNGSIEGLDGDVINAVAAKLHLTVQPQLTDFNGMLGGVQSQRVDIAVGGIAWSKDREQQGLFTDPPYYSPPAMAVHGNADFRTIADLAGHNVGTVTGYVWVKAIQDVPGATLHTYPDANGVLADLAAGRIDVAFLDPLLILYTQKQRPDMGFHTEYLTPPSAGQVAAHPSYQYFQAYQTGFYVPKQESALAKAVSEQIDAMYSDGEMAKLITKWGGDPAQFLRPSAGMTADRRAVDRPATWNAPSA